jgi:hypothetical protein
MNIEGRGGFRKPESSQPGSETRGASSALPSRLAGWKKNKRGELEIFPLEKEHYPLCRDLMRRYKDQPMDLADGTLVALAGALAISRVFTLDHRDFSIYRFKQTRRFTLIPPKLP